MITIRYARAGNAEPMYSMTDGDKIVVGATVERLFFRWRSVLLFHDFGIWPSKSLIRLACKLARENASGAILSRCDDDGKWIAKAATEENGK